MASNTEFTLTTSIKRAAEIDQQEHDRQWRVIESAEVYVLTTNSVVKINFNKFSAPDARRPNGSVGSKECVQECQ